MTLEDANEPMDPQVAALADSYHRPPDDTPRELMWQRIQAARRSRGHPIRRQPGWIQRALPMAAVLIVGIALGSLLRPGSRELAPAVVATQQAPAAGYDIVFRTAATRHLQQAEQFLVLFRDAVQQQATPALAPGAARQLLVSNRLLLASPAASDDSLRALLEDVEFILMQITQLPVESGVADPSLITDGLSAGEILPRLRSVVHTRTPAAMPQGVI